MRLVDTRLGEMPGPLTAAAGRPMGRAMSIAERPDLDVSVARPTVPDPAPDEVVVSLPLPWRAIIRWAVAGTLVMLALVAFDVKRYGGGNPVSLLQPGTGGPAAALFHRDFPEIEQPPGLGLDGQMYYAIATDPLHPEAIARYLDRPRYRLQHPLLSWLGWAVGLGGADPMRLTWALALVGVAGLLVGGLATGCLSATLRGPPWLAALFPLLPGAYWSLRVTVSDALALALALAAVALAARSRTALAVVAGILAVLAKEPLLLVLVGWALARRTRRDTLVAVVPAVVAAAWMLLLRTTFSGSEATTDDLALPLTGLVHAWTDLWSNGRELVGMACTVAAIGVGVAALVVRRFGHPLSWIVAVQLAYLSVMGVNPLGVNFGATRMSLPILVVGTVALLTPDAGRVLRPGSAPLRRSAVQASSSTP